MFFFIIKKGRTRPNQMINLKVNFTEWRVYKCTGVVVVLVELLLDSLIYNQCLHRTPIVTQTDPYPYCHPNRPVPLLSFKQTRWPRDFLFTTQSLFLGRMCMLDIKYAVSFMKTTGGVCSCFSYSSIDQFNACY